MIQKKSKNKFLLTTSLFSLTMGMLSLNAMADTVEHKTENVAVTIKSINDERNVPFPQTDNTKAVYKTNINEKFREKAENENWCFKGPDGKCINCKSTNGERCNEDTVAYKGDATSNYILTDKTEVKNGYVVGSKSVVSDEGSNGYSNKFFRYWKSNGKSTDGSLKNGVEQYEADPQFSASYPKLCYTGFSTPNSLAINADGNYKDSLIRLAENGGDSARQNKLQYRDSYIMIPIIDVNINTSPDMNKGVFLGGNTSILDKGKGNLPCSPSNKNCRLVDDDKNRGCLTVKYEPNLNNYVNNIRYKPKDGVGYDFETGTPIALKGCTQYDYDTCPSAQVKSFSQKSASGEPYRKSKYVSIDITGNNELIEIPGQSCHRCLNVATSGVEDTSCEYILKEVWDAKEGFPNRCEETVKALVTNPRTSTKRNYLPADMNNQYNCSSCLCKIEELLKKDPYRCG